MLAGRPTDYTLISIEDCLMLKRNPQYMTEKQMESLKKSIKQDGFLAPIVVRPRDGKYEILSGNHRWLAAKEVGLKEIPVVIADLDDKQAQRIAINMNTVHGDPTVELMAPFLADMEDEVLASVHFEKQFLKDLCEFDELLQDRINSLEVPDSIDYDSPKTPLPDGEKKYCDTCGQPIR